MAQHPGPAPERGDAHHADVAELAEAAGTDHEPRHGAEVDTAEIPAVADGSRLVVITGMSGAGRSITGNVLDDMGWHVTDGLPPQLLVPLATLLEADGDARVAATVDVRSGAHFDELTESLQDLRDRGWNPQVLFLDATDETLVRRFESVRRPHPLQGDGGLLDGIHAERERLADLRSVADIVVDTSGFNVHQLTAKITSIFHGDRGPRLRVAVMSFGFKYGIPLDADIVFDMRFLPNPFWIPELRQKTGLDPEVSGFVFDQLGADEFIDRAVALLDPMISGYLREGRRYITVAVGCTGGKHRSVATAERLSHALAGPEVGTITVHRDLGRE